MKKLTVITWILVLVACGKTTSSNGPGRTPPAQLEQQFPALAWVPADATYVVAGKVGEISLALREILSPASMLPIPAPEQVDQALRGLLGVSLLSARDLSAIGLAVDETAALFSAGAWPTLVLPIEDGVELQVYLEKNRPTANVRLREQDGVEVVTWTPAPNFAVSYARVDKWLLLRVADPSADAKPGAWLDAARSTFASGGIAGNADLVGAAKQVRQTMAGTGPGGPAILGFARVSRFVEALEDGGSCAGAIGGAIESVAMGFDVSPRKGGGVLSVGLSPAAAAALRAGATTQPLDGYMTYRQTAGLYGDLAVDVRWLDGTLARAGCPPVGVYLRDVTRSLDMFGARSVHIAIRQLLLDQRKVQAAVFASLRGREAIDRGILDNIPGRSLLERKVSIGGLEVRVIDLGVIPRIGYRLSDEVGVAAVGGDTIDQVFGGSPTDADQGVLLAAMGARPERMPDMEAALAVVFEQMGYSSALASSFVSRVLSRYADAGVEVRLVGDAIELRGWFQLAP